MNIILENCSTIIIVVKTEKGKRFPYLLYQKKSIMGTVATNMNTVSTKLVVVIVS